MIDSLTGGDGSGRVGFSDFGASSSGSVLGASAGGSVFGASLGGST